MYIHITRATLVPMRRCGFNPWVGKILWRRKWQYTPVFLPGEFHGLRSLMDHSPYKEKPESLLKNLTNQYIYTHNNIYTICYFCKSSFQAVFDLTNQNTYSNS